LRILFFSAFFQAKGHETYLSDEIKGVAEKFPLTQFLVYTTNSERNSTKKLSKNILWVERKNLKNIQVIILFLKEMIKIFTKFKPNVVHSTYVLESLIMGFIGRVFRVPTILHGRGTDLNYYPFLSLRKNIIARISCRLNKKILTVSKTMKREVMRLNVPEKKIQHIYNGVDNKLFQPKLRRNYSNIKRFELIHIGRYSPEKCQDLMIKVVKDLKDNGFNVHLTLIGFGHKILRDNIGHEIKKELIRLIKKYDLKSHISLLGFIDHEKIPEYLEMAQIYIQPSLTEGLPNSVLEAMCMELPIIMTKAGGMLELNIKPGIILIEKNNRKQLYGAIINFIKNPEIMKTGGKKNREFIVNNFNWDIHIKKLYEVYTELMRKNN